MQPFDSDKVSLLPFLIHWHFWNFFINIDSVFHVDSVKSLHEFIEELVGLRGKMACSARLLHQCHIGLHQYAIVVIVTVSIQNCSLVNKESFCSCCGIEASQSRKDRTRSDDIGVLPEPSHDGH